MRWVNPQWVTIAWSSAMTVAAELAPKDSKVLNILLWVGQVTLAGMFGMAGVSKATRPIPELAPQMPWTADIPEALVRFIGTAEFLGALGLVLPALTRIRPGLTPLAAAGLVAIMVLASVFHATRGEPGGIVVNVVLGSVAAFVAWGRYRKLPIAPR
jgi:putative oxidoreductase